MTLNVIKVLSVINFGPKRNKSSTSSRITIGPKLDEGIITMTETCNGLKG